MASRWRDLATVDLGGAVLGEVLRASDKSLLALGPSGKRSAGG